MSEGYPLSLTPFQQRSLSYAWILRDRDPAVQVALEAGFAVHWSNNVKAAFVSNDADHVSPRPSTWAHLGEAIGMNAGHVSRYSAELEGKEGTLRQSLTLPNSLVRHRVALALGIPDEGLSPGSCDWIAESAKWLIRICFPKDDWSRETEFFRPYAAYLVNAVPGPPPSGLCPKGLDGAQHCVGRLTRDEIRQAVLDTAHLVGKALSHIQLESDS